MTGDKKYLERLSELKPLIYCLQCAIELFGKDEAGKLAKVTLEKYARERFVAPYENIPPDERWPKFRDDIINNADDVQYSLEVHSENKVKIRHHRCIFMEIFRVFGLEEFVPYYCDTDYTTARAISPDIKFTRTQTVVSGAPYCDHCWEYRTE